MPRKYAQVPELSLKAYTDGDAVARAEFEEALFEGFKYFGFIILKDHKVSHALLSRAYKLSAEFFAQREDKKLPFVQPDCQRGYTPPIPEGADQNSIRAAAHEDINLITILVAAEGGGLELLDRDGKWLPIDTDPENLIVDAGDMLARITNDLIPATTHRVVNPSGPNVSRYSIPFFMHPHPDAMLSCIESCKEERVKYPDIRADDFLRERLAEIGLAG